MQRAFFEGEAKPEFMVCSVMSGRNCHASFLDELIRLKRPEYPHLTDDSLARVIMNEGRGIAADTTTVLDADVSRYQSGDWVVKVYEYAEGIVMARVDPFFENADNLSQGGGLASGRAPNLCFCSINRAMWSSTIWRCLHNKKKLRDCPNIPARPLCGRAGVVSRKGAKGREGAVRGRPFP